MSEGRSGGTASSSAGLTEEEAKRRAAFSRKMTMSLGAMVTVLMQSKAHRELKLAEIEAIVAPAAANGQFSLAEATLRHSGMVAPVALVMWAAVSGSVDQRLMAAPGQPMGLSPPDWHSGNNVWIVEAVGEQKVLSELIERLKTSVWKGLTVKMRAEVAPGTVGVHVLLRAPEK